MPDTFETTLKRLSLASFILTKQQNKSNSQVRFIPDLSAAALKQSKHKELGLWYRLRTLDQPGTGIISVDFAIKGLIEVFGYTQRTAFRHLRQGDDILWHRTTHKTGHVIKIYALRRVYEYFITSAYQGDKHFREIPAAQFQLGSERLQLYASTFKPAGIQSNPISRASIEDYTGVGKQQQIRYHKQARINQTPIKKTPCYGVYQVTGDNGATRAIPEKVTVYSKKKGSYEIPKRLPNIYHSSFQASNKGQLKKVTQVMAKSLITGEATPPTRRYFKGLKSLLQAFWSGRKRDPRHLQEGYKLLHSNNRLIKGRLEWCRQLICA